MQHTQSTLEGAGGLRLFTQSWLPDGAGSGSAAKAALVLVHGYGEHSGRYANLVNALVPHGIAVYSYDHRGHGRSPGQRGHIMAWDEYRGDLERLVAYVRSQTPAPVFLYAHSMGALIALEYLLHQPKDVAGAVISGAPIQPGSVAPPAKVLLAKVLSGIVPTFSVPFGDGTTGNLSRDPAVQTAFDADPLTHNAVSVRWGTEAMAAVERVKTQAGRIQVPLLLVHGGADRMNLPQGVQGWVGGVGSADKELKLYPGNLHEVHNDYDAPKLMEDVRGWIEQRVQAFRGP
ncbi:MAG: alpha/beta hydrolase [Meiothermus sp.]|nr:alpha/beta hydrolase [Meiothermus sp.]